MYTFGSPFTFSYLCRMTTRKITPKELWSRQQMNSLDVDYDWWNEKRKSLQEYAQISPGCLFAVDVFKARYDFASDRFACLFGYNPAWLKTIRKQGDMLEERIHPDDRDQLRTCQIAHGQFIYSLPPEERNDYQQTFQFRMLNAKQQYVNVISRQQVFQQDKAGKAWIILGMMDLSPDQTPAASIKRTVANRKTGEIISPVFTPLSLRLTPREKEILSLIRQGLLSKEIAGRLNLSIYTVNNHRKNILAKLDADNVIEAINRADDSGVFY